MSLQYPVSARTSVSIYELFKDEIAKGITIYVGALKHVDVAPLSTEEEGVLRRYIRHVGKVLERISPVLARNFLDHESFFVKCAQMFKAIVQKPLVIPPVPGTFGVTVIFPQAIKYTASPSSTEPAYTSYKSNSWEIDLTAGSPIWFLGDGTNYYRASPVEGKKSMLAIIQDGLIEIGTTPKLYQMKMITQQDAARGPFAVAPLTEIPVEYGKAIYQYNHPALIVRHDFGVMWGALPAYSGTGVFKILGLVFYEYDFFSTFKTI